MLLCGLFERFYKKADLLEKLGDIDGAINKAVDKCDIELKNAGYKSDKENSKVVQKLIWQKNYIERCRIRAQKREIKMIK